MLAQYSSLVIDEALLKEVMPEADSFSEKSGNPPVYRAYKSVEGSAEPSVIGYLFVTPDLPPEEIGYAAPIEVLVGMDIEGTITGMKIIFYRESYRSIRGDFLATERFPDQFKDKNISEGFRVGRDVDGVSRATISSWAVARGIRSSGRRVARAYMKDSDFVVNSGGGAVGLRYLAEQSWEQMLESGLVETLDIVQDDLTELKLTFIYMGNDGMGEQLVGIEDYSRAEREASRRGRGGNMVIVGVDGNASMPFRQERLAVQQGESIFPIRRDRFVYVGSAEAGKITGKFRFAGAIVLDRQIDITQEFKILYDTGNTVASYEGATYKVPPVPLALVQGTPLPAELLANDSDGYDDDGVYGKLINSAPWGEVAALLLLLTLVMISFLRKSSALRWVTLACTLIYLGFINGTFLSISHVTNGIKLGPSLFLRDLPLLIIVVFTLVTTLFWGRVFCSSLCPFGALQDFITRFVPRRFQKELPQAIHDKAIYIKYAVLALLIVTTLSYSEISIFQYFEPFGTLFYQSQSILLWGILIAFLLASTVVSRFYCRYACPLGATLGVIALISPWRIKRVTQCQVCKVCEGACPTGAIRGPDIDFKECVRCDICEIKLINKAGVCRHSVEKVAARHKSWTPVTVT
ncbi:MAG: 4Fe-4S binding protein [Gammaproteobacteria bacterium]|nr:4Fe-4S binding protein [Gammaproteobacteria bacterium]